MEAAFWCRDSWPLTPADLCLHFTIKFSDRDGVEFKGFLQFGHSFVLKFNKMKIKNNLQTFLFFHKQKKKNTKMSLNQSELLIFKSVRALHNKKKKVPYNIL